MNNVLKNKELSIAFSIFFIVAMLTGILFVYWQSQQNLAPTDSSAAVSETRMPAPDTSTVCVGNERVATITWIVPTEYTSSDIPPGEPAFRVNFTIYINDEPFSYYREIDDISIVTTNTQGAWTRFEPLPETPIPTGISFNETTIYVVHVVFLHYFDQGGDTIQTYDSADYSLPDCIDDTPTTPPAAPNASITCSDTTPILNISWTNPDGYTAGSGNDYAIDVAENQNFTLPYWNRFIEGVTSNTTITSSQFNSVGEATTITFNPSTTYYARIAFLQVPNLYSEVDSFIPISCEDSSEVLPPEVPEIIEVDDNQTQESTISQTTQLPNTAIEDDLRMIIIGIIFILFGIQVYRMRIGIERTNLFLSFLTNRIDKTFEKTSTQYIKKFLPFEEGVELRVKSKSKK